MATLQIGRIGADVTVSPPFTNLEEVSMGDVSEDGEEIYEFTLNLETDSTTKFKNWVRQLQGYANAATRQETAVPVIHSTWTELKGFYRPIKVSIPIGPGNLDNADISPVTLTMQRVAQYSRPIAYHRLFGTVRANDNSITEANCLPWVAVPVGVNGGVIVSGVTDTALDPSFTRTGYQGTFVVVGATAYNFKLWDAVLAYDANPDNWYLGACQAAITSTDYAGSGPISTFLASGSMRTGVQAPHNPARWFMSNHNLIVWTDPATPGTFCALVWDPDTSSYNEFATFTYAAASGKTLLSATCIENTVSRTTMKLQYVNTTTGQITNVYVSLRRGSLFVEFYGEVPSGGTLSTWDLYENALGGSSTATATAGGRVTNNATAGSNKWVFAMNRVAVASNNGIKASSSQASCASMLGFVHNGAAAATGNRADDLVKQWYGTPNDFLEVGAGG